MHFINYRRTKWLMLLVAVAMTVTLFAGCTGEEEKPTLTLFDGSWGSLWLENAIAKIIIEEGYGYPCEVITVSSDVMNATHPKGDLLINMEQWPQNNPEWYQGNLADGTLLELGVVLEGGPQFWCIPQWVHEEYGIDTVLDMKDHWELFPDPEDSSKGMFINCKVGWNCERINVFKFEAYGLGEYYNIISPGTAGAEAAAMAGPQKKGDPVFGYYWAPTDLMGMFDWYILEEPAYDADVWAKIAAKMENPDLAALTEACAYESVPLTITVHKDLLDMAPDVVTMLRNFTVGLDRCNKSLAFQMENEIDEWETVAVWWMREYDSHWKTWVPTSAYTEIKAFLDDFGPVP
jgi:glycine betaine/proline transport system substrate-binding protein